MTNTFEVPYFGLVPETWKTSRFKYLFNLRKGLSITKADLVDEGIPVISYGQIHSKSNTGTHLSADLLRSIPESITRRASLLKEEDIVFADTSEDYIGIGNAAYIDCPSPVYAGYHTIWARCKAPCIYPKYYAYLFLTDEWRNQIRINSFGVKVFSVTQKLLSSSFVLFPPLQIQKKIVAYLDTKCLELDSLSSDIQKEIETLEAYKKSLITEAVTKGLDKYVSTKASGYDYLGSVPISWDVRRLRFLGTCSNGISKSHEYFGSGFPFVTYGDVYNNFSLPETSSLIESSEIERRRYSVEKGDIFFTRTSETIEEIAFSSACLKTIEEACFAGFLIRFRPTVNMSTKFLMYYFRSDIHRKFFTKEMNLVTRASLSQDLLKNLPVLIPPRKEQDAIAEFLDSKCSEIDSIISSKKQQLETLVAYKKSLIYEYVTGKKEVPAV